MALTHTHTHTHTGILLDSREPSHQAAGYGQGSETATWSH